MFLYLDFLDYLQLLGCCLTIFVIFLGLKPFYHKDERAISWIVSLFSSLVLSCIGTMRLANHIKGIETFDREIIYSDDAMSRFALIFFVSVNIMDLLLGPTFYPSQLSVLTSYVHHFFYGAFVLTILAHRHSHGFIFCFFEELPTLILAVGNLVPILRSDMLFGISFFAIRLVYHVWLCFQFMLCYWESAYWKICTSVTVLHVFWMYKWTVSMVRRTRRKEGASRVRLE